jgi:hypothetical protein
MAPNRRRRFIGWVGSVAAALSAGPREAAAQAFPKVTVADTEEGRRRLAQALRELNQAAGLGVTAEDFDRAEAYVTGALVEAEARLRPLVLPASLDLPVVFKARRRS